MKIWITYESEMGSEWYRIWFKKPHTYDAEQRFWYDKDGNSTYSERVGPVGVVNLLFALADIDFAEMKNRQDLLEVKVPHAKAMKAVKQCEELEMTLPRYNKNAKCPKCESNLITTEYNVPMMLMERRCSECSYVWHELPLDTPEPPKAS